MQNLFIFIFILLLLGKFCGQAGVCELSEVVADAFGYVAVLREPRRDDAKDENVIFLGNLAAQPGGCETTDVCARLTEL
jgi:hypothetical protein